MNPDIPGEVLFVEQLTDDPYDNIIRRHHGFEEQVCKTETEEGATYYHGKVNLKDGSYAKDTVNKSPIEIDGVTYELDSKGEVFIPKAEPVPELNMSQIAMQMSSLEAQLVMADVIPMTTTEKEWGERYAMGMVSDVTIGLLEESGKVKPSVVRPGGKP